MAKKKIELVKVPFDVEDITALDVLGMMVRRTKPGISPCLLVMSNEARAEIRAMGSEWVDKYKRSETEMKTAREAGNPRAFFIE